MRAFSRVLTCILESAIPATKKATNEPGRREAKWERRPSAGVAPQTDGNAPRPWDNETVLDKA